MAPHKAPRPPALSTVYKELEKSLSFNCTAVLDAATAQIGATTVPLIAGITSKNELWAVLHKYKTVCFSLESRLALLSVVTDFCLGSAAAPTIAKQDSNPHTIHELFDKLGKEWDYLFQAVNSLPTSRRLQECKIKSVHSIFSRWAALVHSNLMSKLQSKASEICFKTYSLEPLKRGLLNCNKYTAEECSPDKENDEALALLNIKLELKRLCLGSLQLNKAKDKLLQLYLGQEIVLGIQPAGKQETGIILRKEHLDGVVVYLGDDESDSGFQDKLFLYPNSSGCRVIMEALAQLTDGCPPLLVSAQGEERRVLVHFKRKVKEEMVENVVALLRRLVGNNVVEVDQVVAEAILNKKRKASRLFSSGAKEGKREREEESVMSGKAAKVMKQNGDQKIENRKTLESKENVKLRCFKCGFDTSDRSALNSHILTHFIKEFLKMLPGFSCPQCPYKNVDRDGLAHHYAFIHLKILDFISVEQLRGIAKVRAHTGITMRGDQTVAEIKDTEKTGNSIFSITKTNTFYSSDSATDDNSDDSYNSLPDIDRKSPSPEPEVPDVPLTVTGKRVSKPEGTRIVLRGVKGIDLNPQQMSQIKQTIKQKFSKKKAIARKRGKESPTKVSVSFPDILIRASQAVKPNQQVQSTDKVKHQQMQQSTKDPQEELKERDTVLPQLKHQSKVFQQKIQQPNKVDNKEIQKQNPNKTQDLIDWAQKHYDTVSRKEQPPQSLQKQVLQQEDVSQEESRKLQQPQTEMNQLELQKQEVVGWQQGRVPPTKVLFPANIQPLRKTEVLQLQVSQEKIQHQKEVFSFPRDPIPQQETLAPNQVPPTEVTDLQIHHPGSVLQHQQNEPQHKSLGITSSSKSVTSLSCGLVRIGSFPVSPQDNKVLLHENCLELLVADVFHESVVPVSVVPVRIDVAEIQSALVCFSEDLPLLVLLLTPVSCSVLTEILGMNKNKKFQTNQGAFCTYSNSSIDSNSGIETQKRIIFCLEKISEDAKKALRNFLKDDLTELQETEAKELLRRSGHVIIKDTRLDKLVLPEKTEANEIVPSDQSSITQNERQNIPKPSDANETRKETDPAIGENNQSPTKSTKSGCSCDDCTYVTPTHRARMERNKIQCFCHPCKIDRLERSQEKNTVREETKLATNLEKKVGNDKRHPKGAKQKRRN